MKPGSVIVDMAAEQGGNCELTEPGEVVVRHGVTIIGYTDLPSRLAKQASTLYATNLLRLAEDLCKTKDGDASTSTWTTRCIRGTTVIEKGAVTWPPPPPKLSAAPPAAAAKPRRSRSPAKKAHGHGAAARRCRRRKTRGRCSACGALLFLADRRASRRRASSAHFTVFVLACFVGYMVVWNVTPALHTPLMSVTNAISSIIIIGALVQVAPDLTAISADLSRPTRGSAGCRSRRSRSPRSTCSAASPSRSACSRCSASRGRRPCPPASSTVAYLGATILFILSLGGLSNPETSRRGNLYGMIGMAIAVLATVVGPHVTPAGLPCVVGALAVGAAIGLYASRAPCR